MMNLDKPIIILMAIGMAIYSVGMICIMVGVV